MNERMIEAVKEYFEKYGKLDEGRLVYRIVFFSLSFFLLFLFSLVVDPKTWLRSKLLVPPGTR